MPRAPPTDPKSLPTTVADDDDDTSDSGASSTSSHHTPVDKGKAPVRQLDLSALYDDYADDDEDDEDDEAFQPGSPVSKPEEITLKLLEADFPDSDDEEEDEDFVGEGSDDGDSDVGSADGSDGDEDEDEDEEEEDGGKEGREMEVAALLEDAIKGAESQGSGDTRKRGRDETGPLASAGSSSSSSVKRGKLN
ncbi:hypothetical protein HKX48_006930 [Thoreauomyces humboldtii]|nr:hypothetical protein HKX48_006930 [Thoreauomyces humboldtii]